VFALDVPDHLRALNIWATLGGFAFLWLLVALAALDAEHLWLPDSLTFPGIVLGIAMKVVFEQFGYHASGTPQVLHALLFSVASAAAAAALILLIRWLYWLIRRREGVGLGDAKLMALLAAWLGLPLGMLALFFGVTFGAMGAVVVLAAGSRRSFGARAATALPFGTFLCAGGIVSAFWGRQILDAYLRWSGL